MHRLDGVRNVPNVIFPRATSQVENFPNVLLPKQQLSKGLAKASEAQQAAKGPNNKARLCLGGSTMQLEKARRPSSGARTDLESCRLEN